MHASTPLANSALRRKIAAHRPVPPSQPALNAATATAIARALRRAAMPFEGLGLAPGQIDVAGGQPLQAAIAALPEHGLVAGIEDEQGRRGLIALSSGLIDALVEVQTTGRVEAHELAPRKVTRIDEALTRDFVDLGLAAFAQEGRAIEGGDWPARMSYGSRIGDRGQINLLLPEGEYTILQVAIAFDGVARQARFVMALPRLRLADAAPGLSESKPPDAAWVAARDSMLGELCLSFDVVLLRLHQPLAQVEALAAGDLIPFSPNELHAVALEDGQGRVLCRGRLGQIGGRRALRLPSSGDVAHPAPQTGIAHDLPDAALSAARRATS